MSRVIREFVNEHKLFPQRIVILGPPVSGIKYDNKKENLNMENYYQINTTFQ